MTSDIKRTFYPIVNYSDPVKAMEWLEKAFGFVPHHVYKDDEGRVVHGEMRYDTGVLMFGNGEPGTSAVYVAVDDPDAHHDRAKAAGAEIFRELADQDYGSRDYAARDPEGNEWYFGTYRS
ncbi:VOC family protein [Actinomadura fibrosa]|uniref:VOC family protein n=1 Tax=Actinomadura fibrosa TaxID=111802 RepID=A0ABW2XSL0_9ACTN|nr:VOC family protein [Actinomadura fibrosa]